MKYRFYLLGIFIVWKSISVFSQDSLANALLWEIKGNGLTKSSYLFGTIHIIPAEDFFYPAQTLDKLELSDRVYMELDMDKLNDMSTMITLLDKIMMSDGSSLSDYLDTDQYQVVKNYFDKVGMPMMMVDRMKPMFLQILADPSVNAEGLKNGKMKSYEMEFMNEAKKRKKKMEGLESIEFQIGIFDSIPYKDQANYLYHAITESSQASSELDLMIAMYKQQNLNALSRAIDADDSGLGSNLDVLLNNRNKNWIPKIEAAIKNKSCFFAVGAGHLAGKNGLIQLLKNQGYTLHPIN